ncbi:MAG TPA: SDR family oxidoreductase [Candidatus Coprovicinus avistercoris]|uniref:SDR family oxidoreductase n=1 Tax=Candidatus Coprovicinus avistercoris TaxID=2840754 RepID=A0A9D1HVK0_9ACTN|nr:SDR family oxidoreductase [Candidatus Coprovicinus avistercoris]
MQAVIYGISKAGLNYTVRLLASAGAADSVRVNAVSPGITKTDILAQAPEEVVAQTISTVPMKKMAMPKELAEAALFLVSDSAGSITGQVLCVDNGQTL